MAMGFVKAAIVELFTRHGRPPPRFRREGSDGERQVMHVEWDAERVTLPVVDLPVPHARMAQPELERAVKARQGRLDAVLPQFERKLLGGDAVAVAAGDGDVIGGGAR